MNKPNCTYSGCQELGIEVLYPDLMWFEVGAPLPPKGECLCTEHLHTKGFCNSCGEFVAGLEIWKNPHAQKTKVCLDCWDELKEELDDGLFYEDEY
jgi:hypothetical protein